MTTMASLELQTPIREEAPIMFLPREYVHTHSRDVCVWGWGGGERKGWGERDFFMAK